MNEQERELDLLVADLEQENRKLRASNQELLDALKAMLANGADFTAVRDAARAAIARATGEQK